MIYYNHYLYIHFVFTDHSYNIVYYNQPFITYKGYVTYHILLQDKPYKQRNRE